MIVKPEHSFLIQFYLAEKKAGKIGREAIVKHYQEASEQYLPEVAVDDPYLKQLIQEINRRFVAVYFNSGVTEERDSYPHIGGESHVIFMVFHDKKSLPKPTGQQANQLKDLFIKSGWTSLECWDYDNVEEDYWGPNDRESWWLITKYPTPYYASDHVWLDSVNNVIRLELAK